MIRRCITVLLFVGVALGTLSVSLTPDGFVMTTAAAQTKSYGCFRIVNATSVRIRKRPYLWSKTLDYAQRGTKVVKNRRFCSIRGTWCRIRKGNVSGWIGKAYLKPISC